MDLCVHFGKPTLLFLYLLYICIVVFQINIFHFISFSFHFIQHNGWKTHNEVGCLRQTECTTDSHYRRSQELCCCRSRHLEQPTNRPASFVTVDGNFCTTPEGTCSVALNDIYACSASEFF